MFWRLSVDMVWCSWKEWYTENCISKSQYDNVIEISLYRYIHILDEHRIHPPDLVCKMASS